MTKKYYSLASAEEPLCLATISYEEKKTFVIISEPKYRRDGTFWTHFLATLCTWIEPTEAIRNREWFYSEVLLYLKHEYKILNRFAI